MWTPNSCGFIVSCTQGTFYSIFFLPSYSGKGKIPSWVEKILQSSEIFFLHTFENLAQLTTIRNPNELGGRTGYDWLSAQQEI